MHTPTALALVLGLAIGAAADEPIVNPYYAKTEWRVWRLDPTPISGVRSLEGPDGKETAATIVLAPIAPDKRRYPVDIDLRRDPNLFLAFATQPTPSARYAGMWDDVYASWSRRHGYVRNVWKGPSTNEAVVLDQIMHLVDVDKNLQGLGINFVHQSTTGMSHRIANSAELALAYEKIYFADTLVCAPAHASYTEAPDRTNDLLLGSFPAIFNSVGSSDSETMAISKMIIAGAHLRPELKLLLKRHGLYPSALLHIWKASLPWVAPYASEVRHRIAYNSVGERAKQPGYGFAGSERGDQAAAFHDYDDALHLERMVARAKALTDPPPEAILDVHAEVAGGTLLYRLKKAAIVVQEPGKTVRLTVSTSGSYHVLAKPVRVRWAVLYGSRHTTVVPTEDGKAWTIEVPWDEGLPEGRTAIALFAHDGTNEGNPAIVSVFRKRSDLPSPPGSGDEYAYPSPLGNRRPMILDAQDTVATPGKPLEITVRALDPEGFPLRYYVRDQPGVTADGNVLTYDCPRTAGAGTVAIPFAVSDGTAGNGYAGRTIAVHVKPKIHARIVADRLSGPAPLKVKLSAQGSFDEKGGLKCGWATDGRAPPPKGLDGLEIANAVTKTFDKPGRHDVLLVVEGSSGRATSTVAVWVGEVPPAPGALEVEAGGVSIAADDDTPAALDYTELGRVAKGATVEREYLIHHRGTLDKPENASVTLEGDGAAAFRVTVTPRRKLGGGDSSRFVLRFAPKTPGEFRVWVVVKAAGVTHRFTVRGVGEP